MSEIPQNGSPGILLAHHLKKLKLPTFLREHEKLARHCAAENLDHTRFLLRLAELELIDRERRMVERRSEEHTSELQSLMRISYAVFCLNKKLHINHARTIHE